MTNTMFRRGALMAAVLGALTLSGSVLAFDEAEQNHPIPSAQVLSQSGNLSIVTGGATIAGEIRNAASPKVPDVDFFSFYARKDDILNFSIDSKSSANGMFLPVLTVLGGATPYPNLREQVSFNVAVSPKIEKFLVPADGIYVVAVSGFPCMLNAGGTCKSTLVGSTSTGSYSLGITPAIPPALQVEINIKPGGGETAPINPKSKGNIPVALISNEQQKFNALQVDLDTLRFGATGEEMSLRRCDAAGVDVSGDGVLDMVCQFETEKTNLTEESVEGVLKGKIKGGGAIEGHGRLKINMPKGNL
jgi:hypothetical protein